MSAKIWVLVDNRVGSSNQALALADEIGEKYEIKRIKYNWLAKLPNFILRFSPFHVKSRTIRLLKNETLPEIIISSGRRTAALAIYLKRLSKGRSKIIQIMRPYIDPSEFELIILPQHDVFKQSLPNVVRIIGALNSVHHKISNAGKELIEHYPNINKFIAVIIGGSNKYWDFNEENAQFLANKIIGLSEFHSMPLFISFSRRTPEKVKKLFQSTFYWPHILYDPTEGGFNPYPGILAGAEYIMTTVDSISICSEAASTGKPLYVFVPENFTSKKHKFFIQQLVDLEIVRILDINQNRFEIYHYEPLLEISKIASIVKKL